MEESETDITFTVVLLVLMIVNILLYLASRGYVLQGVVAMFTIAICSLTIIDAAALTTYPIMFHPYMQVMVIVVALICMVGQVTTKT